MTRKEQIEKAYEPTQPMEGFVHNQATLWRVAFQAGAEWADANPINRPLGIELATRIAGFPTKSNYIDTAELETKLSIAVEAFKYLSTCPEPFVVSQINGGEYVTLSGYANAVLAELKKGAK